MTPARIPPISGQVIAGGASGGAVAGTGTTGGFTGGAGGFTGGAGGATTGSPLTVRVPDSPLRPTA